MKRPAITKLTACGLAALVALTVFACANGSGVFDGGVGGTGVGSATIQGNVMMDGVTSLANVRVRARGTSVEAVTDQSGFFELFGIDAGDVTLEFRRISERQPATVDVFAASGSIVTLTDVHFVGDAAEPAEIDMSNIVGTLVADAACDAAGGTFDVDDGELTFAVTVDAGSVMEGPNGAATCADLTAGTQVKLRGRQDGLTIVATDLRVLH